MWTGISALKNIDQSLQSIRNEVVRLDSQLDQLTNHLAANQRHRAKLINDIAAVRLKEIDSGDLRAGLTAADHEASDLLEQRDTALSGLNETIDQTNQQILQAEQHRESLLETVNQTSQKIVDAEGLVQQKLAVDAAYMAQLEKAKQAESISEEALDKVERAQQSMSEKAKPYEADDLFMYLWNRGFGTTEYSGGLFARFMDGWVARIIKYQESRVNFWNLTEIPQRLSEHAKRVGDAADEQHLALQQLELNALNEAGVKNLEVDLDALRAKIDAHDDAMEQSENRLNDQLEERAMFTAGEDDYIKRCLARLSQALDHQNLNSVYRYVQATVSPTDDRLVIELQSLEGKLDHVEDDLADVRVLHERKINKLKELEKVRRDFKNSRYDDVRSGFGNQALITSALSQFVQGLVSGADVWRVIQRNQRYRQVASAPDFGSGGLGDIADILGGELMRQGRRRRQSQHGSTWHLPKRRSGGGGFRMPRSSGRRSGGGFKTGGGF